MKNKAKGESVAEVGILILAAGLGKRMHSALPKVLHELGGKPMLFHVLNQVRHACPQASVGLVVGHGRELIEKFIQEEETLRDLSVTLIHQAEQKGTGHAARCAMDSPWGLERIRTEAPILVLPGDLPLISEQLIRSVLKPLGSSDAMRVLTCHLKDPTGYGRVIREDRTQRVQGIVEEKDASPQQKQVTEVSTSIYLFESRFLGRSLSRIQPNNAQNEYYLTDLLGIAVEERREVSVLVWDDVEQLRGVNNPWELAQARHLFNQHLLRHWALKGVQFLDLSSVRIECEVVLGAEVVIDAGVVLQGQTRIGDRAKIGPHVVFKDATIDSDVWIKAGTVVEEARVESFSVVGPYAHLRPGTVVGQKAKIGNFVELKKTSVGESTSIAHLSYLGDAEVGSHVNVGCGFVTCNFDGRVIEGKRKHKTVIEDHVFMGSACQAIAPVKIGKGSYIASGSTLTDDVEPGSLAIARARQVNKLDYAKKIKRFSEE